MQSLPVCNVIAIGVLHSLTPLPHTNGVVFGCHGLGALNEEKRHCSPKSLSWIYFVFLNTYCWRCLAPLTHWMRTVFHRILTLPSLYILGACTGNKKSKLEDDVSPTDYSLLDRILTNAEKNQLKSMDRSIYNTK